MQNSGILEGRGHGSGLCRSVSLECGLDPTGSGFSIVVGYCECGSEHSYPIGVVEFLDQTNDYQFSRSLLHGFAYLVTIFSLLS
jgi:hypothetical protein